MEKKQDSRKFWNLELECMPHFEQSMKRVYAWFEGEVIDRAPVKFSLHNAEFEHVKSGTKSWNSLKDRWFDVEYQVESFLHSVEHKQVQGETFPVFWPNLGPNFFAALYGGALTFGEVTSWIDHDVKDLAEAEHKLLDWNNQYLKKITDLTDYALERGKGKFMTGYTDLHPGMDCLCDWRGPQNLCMDFYDEPELLPGALKRASADFQTLFDKFDEKLKAHDQLSVTWMGIPSFGKMHIPSCDFSSLISKEMFDTYNMPILREEVKPMTHNIFHLDGKGVAKHLDSILGVPEIDAVQWVQGEGVDAPILQWIPLIKRIREAGKSVVVNLQNTELDAFMREIGPEGIYICVNADSEEQQKDMLKAIEKWK